MINQPVIKYTAAEPIISNKYAAFFEKRRGSGGGNIPKPTFRLFSREKKFFSSPRFPPALFHAGFVNGEDGGFFPFAFGDFDEGDVAADVD